MEKDNWERCRSRTVCNANEKRSTRRGRRGKIIDNLNVKKVRK